MQSCFSCVLMCATCELQPARLLCLWDSPGKNTGVGGHALLQGISWPWDRTQVSYIYLHWQVVSLPLEPPGKPLIMLNGLISNRIVSLLLWEKQHGIHYVIVSLPLNNVINLWCWALFSFLSLDNYLYRLANEEICCSY